MIRSATRSLNTFVRILVFSAMFVAPVGAFAYSVAGTGSQGLGGAGFVLYVSLQRNAG
ncbi:hypothetical protein [Pseudohoeflea coraliihabitans]|uniref:Uncharacterized protein n=1 Tax=Pseudohoeflea coraliihabitans TaxID=2860393 RepID=A0ABS6WIF1_9HYPH|nr:hypothetical protein [Pseudohoeflea sp. DP4N28-3]MBW3095724.1 hypothetical protein [Pseudohoeflea sp. DP4N28-3]